MRFLFLAALLFSIPVSAQERPKVDFEGLRLNETPTWWNAEYRDTHCIPKEKGVYECHQYKAWHPWKDYQAIPLSSVLLIKDDTLIHMSFLFNAFDYLRVRDGLIETLGTPDEEGWGVDGKVVAYGALVWRCVDAVVILELPSDRFSWLIIQRN